MPIYTVQAADGKIYKLEGPPNASQADLAAAIERQNPYATKTTEQLKAEPGAATSVGDIGRSLGSGLVGGVKSIADVFGAGSDVSEYLGETMQGLQAGLTPERQAEMARRSELIGRADKSGSLMEQAKAYLGGVTEAPLQTTVQALGTSAPAILAGLATLPVSAPAGIAAGVGIISRLAIGAAQGVGEFKGSAYDAVKAHYMKEGKGEVEASRLAEEAQQYSADKALQYGGAALLGSLDAVLGSENVAMKAMRRVAPTGAMTKEAIDAGIKALPAKPLTKPSLGRAFGESVLGEAPLEGAQGAFGQYSQNVAMQQAGIDTPTEQGVFGSGLRDALVGSLAGGVFTPLHKSTMNSAYNIDQFLRQAQGEQEIAGEAQAALKRKQEKDQQNLKMRSLVEGEPSTMLALPAPAAKAEREIEPALIDLQNPVGRITRNELPAETISYIDSYRAENNLPRLTSFSLEDVKDAMTSQNPAGERAALDSIIAAKTGYTGKEKYSPENILNAAVEKNIAPETKGFADFLQRATGERDVNTMSQPQLYSAFNALKATKPSTTGEQIVLPEGSNATRFTTDQYNEGLTLLGKYLEQGEGKPLSMQQATEVVSAQTDLGDYAADILRVAANNDDVIVENGPVFQTVDNETGEVTGSYGVKEDAQKAAGKTATVQEGRGPVVRSRIEEKQVERAKLPGGYELEEETLQAGEKPAEYQIMVEGKAKPLATVLEENDVAGKVKRLQGLRSNEAGKVLIDIQKNEVTVNKGRAALERMEARGQVDTEGYKKAQAQQARAEDVLGRRIQRMLDQIEELSAPLTSKPAGKKQITRTAFKLTKEGKEVGKFPSRAAAEESVLSQLTDAELETLTTQEGPTANRAVKALEARKDQKAGKTGIKVKGTTAGLEAAGVYTQETQAKIDALEKLLGPMLAKFGLQDVGLKIVRTLQAGAEGSYLDKLIQVTLTADKPIITMRHEALHALKDMGFFTPAQWNVLTKKANEEWIGKYLKGINAELNGKVMSRYDAYIYINQTLPQEWNTANPDKEPRDVMSKADMQELLVEEAIADAFSAFELGTDKPTPGLMAALFKRLQNFFAAFAQALGRAKIESAEEIFGKIEKGELAKAGLEQTAKEKLSLAPTGIPQKIWDLHEKVIQAEDEASGRAFRTTGISFGALKRNQTMTFRRLNSAVMEFVGGDEQKSLDLMVKMNEESGKRGETKYSLAGAGVPRSTRSIMESASKFAQAELGLNTEKAKGKSGVNNVRDVGKQLNRYTLDQFGGVTRDDPTAKDVAALASAVADEVGYQLRVSAKTGTGRGWYSNNYPNALKKLGKVFPELETNPLARSVFSAIVAVTSNGEDVSSNIKSAIRYYQDFRNGKPLVATGSRRPTALENNLSRIEKLFEKHGENFTQELTKEITVAELNVYLRSVGEEPSSDYLKETKIPAAAIYFGPKLGAFFANLSGSEGYLTMDLWWTRSINRMRGLLIPKATESSINAFRDLMGRPSATREEVIDAIVPFKQKYEEHGYTTELEFLAKAKEPRTNADRPKWLAKAKRKAGPSFQQLMLEHKLEKMANTIYKNEFDMLEEAPFNASDRKFMYDVARSAQKLLKAEGVDLSLADIQAALWYYEKRLYAKLTGREADDIGYEEAIIARASDNDRREGPSVVFSKQSNRRDAAGGRGVAFDELGGLNEGKLSLRKGVVAEVAPNPDHISATKWREMTTQERLDSTKAVANKIMSRVFSELGLKGYTYTFSSGTYEGEANPNIIVEAPDNATEQELAELGNVLGYVLDQKAMVVFDENNKTSGDQAGFVKVRIPEGMSQEELSGLRSHIAREVPQADGDTLRNDALVYGNFSAYNDKVDTVSDAQYHQAIRDAVESFEYDGVIDVSSPETFHSAFIWPDTRADYLKETRYGDSKGLQGEAGADVRGQGSRRLQAISEDAIALRDRWIDARGAARLGGRERGNAVDYGNPTAEYGIPQKNSVSVIGVHFSQKPRDTLYSEYYGTGLRGFEQQRLSDKANADIRNRIYFYVDNGAGVRNESGVGGSPHVIKLNNLYDTKADPLKYIKNATGADAAERFNKWERSIKEAGFDGYLIKDQTASQDYATLIGKHAVKTKLSLGKTVAVDKDGKPLQLYHATYSAFDTPKINYGTNEWKQFGFHVGPLEAAQNRLGIKAAEDKREGVKSGTGGPNIIPVYLDIRNPLRLDESRTGRWGVDDIMSTIMEKADKDGDISRTDASLSPLDVEMFMADEFPIEAWLAGETDPDSVNFNPNAESKIWSNDSDFAPGEKSKLLIDFLQTLGYDSIVYENKFEGGGDSYIALDAKQVKSQFRPEGKFSLAKTSFSTAEAAEKAAYKKAPPQTPEFKLFYGASTLMEEGRPQVMYHGSDTDISTFYENKPIFVTPEANFAQSFAEDRAKDNGKSPSEARVYPLWVRAETPFDYENREHVEQVMQRLIADQGATKFDSKLRLNKSTGAVDKVREEMKSGLWSVIEDKTVQDVIKQLGFDSFNVMEGGNKNLAVYSAAQVKSVTGNIGEFGREAKDIRFSLKSAVGSFDQGEIAKSAETGYKSRYKLIDMEIDKFLKLAKFGKQNTKLAEAKSRLAEGSKFTSIPYLYMGSEGKDLRVTGHEGRHRAMALQEAGFDTMPVEIRADIRWSEQVDPEKFDYQETWPSRIYAQEGALREGYSIPMPFTREESAKDYQAPVSQEKFSLPAVSKAADDRVDATTTTREVKGFGERITEAISPKAWSYFRAKALHRYNQLGVYDRIVAKTMGGIAFLADKSAEAAALFSDLGAGVTASALGYGDRHGGIPAYRNGVTTIDRSVKGLVASLAPLAKYNNPKIYQYYQYWSAVKRGTRLLEAGKERLINEGDIALAAELEKKFPEFIDVQKDYTAFNNGVVKYMVDTGVLSKERGDEYMKYADYIPFYRQVDGEKTIGPNIFQAIAGVKPPKKLTGSDAPLADFLETIVRNTQASIQAGMKNSAAQRAINVASQVTEPGMGVERLNTKQSGPDIINVLEKGEQVSYRTPDSLLIDAIGSLHMPDIPFLSILSAPSDLLRNLVTKDPGFMLANLMRDSLSAWVTSGQKMTPIAGTVINFGKALANKSPSMQALMDAGIIGGYEFSANVESSGAKLAQDLTRKSGKEGLAAPLRAVRWLWEGLEKGTTASDAATRTLVYERVMAETGNEAEALYRAMEVMNFNRKGSSPVIRVLTAAVPFFNARLQGLDLLYRAASGQMNMDNAKGIQKTFFVNGAMMMGLTAIYWFLTHDDEEYKKQEQETRDNNWLFPRAGIKMPTPFEVGTIFKTIPERILEYTFGNDTGKDFAESMGRSMLSTFAFNPTPQAIKPIVEVVTNFNFFTMRPIIGQGMEDVASQYQVGPGTSKAFEAFGKMTGLSPMKVEHLYKGYTGTMGMYLVDVMDSILNANSNSPNATKRFEQLPVVKRFALDPEARGNITQYYELKNAVDTTVRTMNLLEKTARPAEFSAYLQDNIGILSNKDYVRNLEKSMKELREMRTAIRSSGMTGDEKRDSLKYVGQMENNLTSNIQTVKKSIASMK